MTESVEHPDKYKIFDTSEFQSRQFIGFDAGGVIVLQRRVSYVSALALLIVGLCCLAGVVFVVLFGMSNVQREQLQGQVQELKQAQSQICRSELCLQQAAYLTRIMNHSADPCTDFYEYSCGNFQNVLPYDHWYAYTTVFHEMDRKAQDDIELALVKPLDEHSTNWEYKLKNYYSVCVQYYRTYVHDDNPFVTEVLNKTDNGGLGNYLLGRSLDTASVDLMFRTVSGKYFVPSLFAARTRWNDYLHKSNSEKRYTIWVGRSSQSIGLLRYNIYYSQHKDIYKRFVKEVAQLLIRDSHMQVPNQDQIVETFASDILFMEEQLLKIQSASWVTEWVMFNTEKPDHPDRMVKVSDLTARMSSFIDFKAYLGEIYGRDRIQDDTKVVMYSGKYMDKLNTLFTQMNTNNSMEFKRKLGNYLTWVVASFFEYDLSPEYRLKYKAIRDISYYTYNPEENAHEFCFETSRWGMNKALSALYVRYYFSEASKEKANKLFDQLRQATKEGIDRISWMDTATKESAKRKVDSILEKSGYPDEAKDDNYLDREFSQISEHEGSYFHLLLASIDYKKGRQLRLLDNKYNPADFEHWGQLWDTHFDYHYYDNEVLIQAGILQAPLFSTDLPQQLVYGGYGTLIVHEIMKSFDVIGQSYDQSVGFKPPGWWSQSSVSEYNKRVTCVSDSMRQLLEVYEKDRLGDLSDEEREKKISDLIKGEVNWTAREIGALKNARSAFDLHKMDDPLHKRLPVHDHSEEQMFYISYAQMNCHHKGVYYDWRSWTNDWFPWKILVNVAVAHVPGFANTFNCPSGTLLNPEKRCDLF